MLIGTGRGQQKRGIVAHFLVPTCIVMNKNVFMCMHWIALNVFKLVLALQKLFQNNYHHRKAKNHRYRDSAPISLAIMFRSMNIEQYSWAANEQYSSKNKLLLPMINITGNEHS